MLVVIRSRDGKYLGRRGKESVLVDRERALVFDTDKDHVEQQLLSVNASIGCGWKAEPLHPFEAGQIVSTPGALEALERNNQSTSEYLRRHLSCDWGDLCQEDRQANDEALKEGLRILSAYRLGDGTKIWIITEADRSATTLLLPEEY
jgi:hypothetical protein